MYRVILVVNECFGKQIIELAQKAYVWLVQSNDNDKWANLTWEHQTEVDDPLQFGLSTFQRLEGENQEDLVIRLLEMIDEHHGEYAHDPAWTEIEVIGTSLTTAIKDTARMYRVDKCDITPTGFCLVRSTHNEN